MNLTQFLANIEIMNVGLHTVFIITLQDFFI